MKIIDTSSDEEYECLIPMFARDANAVVITYSVLNRKSFDSVELCNYEKIFNECKNYCSLYLCATQCDTPNFRRKVSSKEGMQKAEELGAEYFETSALSGRGVDEMFQKIAHDCALNDLNELLYKLHTTKSRVGKPSKCNIL